MDDHAGASIYHGTAWMRVIRDTFAKPVHTLVSRGAAEKMRGVLPLVRLNGLLTPDMLVSLPYCNYGGALCDDDDVTAELLDEAASLAASLGCDVVEIRSERAADTGPGWQRRGDKVRMVLELPASPDDLGRALGAKRRSQINRCRREEPEIRVGGAELIPVFYGVFAKKMRDLGTPVYPRVFFENVEKHLREHVRIVVISIGGRPAAAAVLIRFRDTLEIPWAAADRDYDRVAVNMLLYWEALSRAIESGCAFFDFGRCTRDSGTYRFKRQWGAEPRPLEWTYRSKQDAAGAAGTGPGRSAQALARIWQRLPLPVANWLGPRVTSNLPW